MPGRRAGSRGRPTIIRAVSVELGSVPADRLGAAPRPPRRNRVEPCVGGRVVHPHRRRTAASARREADRHLRPAARLPVRRAGQHDRDAARLRRSRAAHPGATRSTARRGSRRPTMLKDVDVLVIDLQDIGARIYTYIYTMANCLRACAAPRHPGDRLRSAEPDRRRRGRGADARRRLRVVRRPVSHPDAPRHDHRRAGAVLQRALRHRRHARGGADGRLDARPVRRPRPGCRG